MYGLNFNRWNQMNQLGMGPQLGPQIGFIELIGRGTSEHCF